MGISALLGLLAGLGLAYARNAMRPGIRNVDEIEQQLGLHVYASVPFSSNQALLNDNIKNKKPGNHLLASHQSNDPAIESLRSLRTSLQFAMLDAPNNIVLITGATPNIGKSFTAANFAAVIAVAGKRVVLIDADMRNPRQHTLFSVSNRLGLSETLAGRGIQAKNYLVLATTSQKQVLTAAYHSYKRCGLAGCILTKLDETASLGEVLSLAISHELPVAYLTDGPRIPDDLHLPRRHQLVSRAVSVQMQDDPSEEAMADMFADLYHSDGKRVG